MRFSLSQKLVQEAHAHQLRSACRDCFHFVENACAHGWPNRAQLRSPMDMSPEEELGALVAFCKEFELL